MKVSIVVGTRPQLIKVSALVKELIKENIEFKLIDTKQHYDYEMEKIFYAELGIPQPIFLNIKSSLPVLQIGKGIYRLAKFLREFQPDVNIVIGDTDSTVIGAVTSVKMKIKTAHIEAGTRHFDRNLPEEINRILVDHISDILFAPSTTAVENLKREGIEESRIFRIDDILTDACLQNVKRAEKKSKILKKLKLKKQKYLVLTLHRQRNVDNIENMKKILEILESLSNWTILFPVHPRTLKNLKRFNLLKSLKKMSHLKITKPLGYLDFLKLMKNSACVLTDSGGIQKEVTILKVPCITLFNSTGWPETVKIGANILVDLDKNLIIKEVKKRTSKEFRKFLQKIKCPYGNGRASKQIIKILKETIK